MSTPTSVARCWALTTMPFSAAAGLSEAALATETATSDQRQAARTQACVNLPKATSNRPDRIFDWRPEAGKDSKIFSPYRPRLAAAKRLTSLVRILFRRDGRELDFSSTDSPLLIRYPAIWRAGRVDC